MKLILGITELKAKLVDTSTKDSKSGTTIACWDVHFRGVIHAHQLPEDIMRAVGEIHLEGDITWYGKPDTDEITEHLHKMLKEI
jgi:hypothetical protein